MTQQPLVESRIKSSQTLSLQPVLAAALASLEVQLDEELARYRRARAGAQTKVQPTIGRPLNQKPLERIDITPSGVQTQLQADEMTAAPPGPIPTPPPPPPPPAPTLRPASTQSAVNIPSVPEVPQTAPLMTPAVTDQTPNNISTPTSYTSYPQATTNPTATAATTTATTTPSTPSSASLVPTVEAQAQSQRITNTTGNRTEPDDYLESSEALLRSLSEEQPAQPPKATKKFNDSLLSPLGIGSMLLLILASATLGVVVMNPEGLRQSPFAKMFAAKQAPAATSSTTNAIGSNRNQSNQPDALLPKSPNLAAREFVDLNLDNVTTLQTKSQPTTAASPSPAPGQTPAATNRTVPQVPTATAPNTTTRVQTIQMQPLMPPNLPPVPVANIPQKPAPTPAATQPQEQKNLKPSASGWFHVVLNNANPKTFAETRKVVPDAYLSPKGTLIYVGAFKTVPEAEQRIKELEAQGVKARIFQL